MLTQLLDLLRADRTRSVDELAQKLDTTPEMVYAMMENLERMGFVRQVDTGCEKACESCALSNMCTRIGKSRMWTLVA
jgi:predicted transcriptional regulator